MTLAFIDTETTGLDPDLHEMWEVGLILRDPGKDDVERTWMLPVDLGRADAFALKVGRFHDRHPQGYGIGSIRTTTPLDEFAESFAEWTYGPDVHLVGANVAFDEERLRRLLKANGACPEWHYHKIDVESLVLGYAAARGISLSIPFKSDDLWPVVGVDPATFDRHTALGDAQLVRAVFDAVMSPLDATSAERETPDA